MENSSRYAEETCPHVVQLLPYDGGGRRGVGLGYGLATRGVWVSAVAPYSPAEQQGVKVGQKITHINQQQTGEGGESPGRIIAKCLHEGKQITLFLEDGESQTDFIYAPSRPGYDAPVPSLLDGVPPSSRGTSLRRQGSRLVMHATPLPQPPQHYLLFTLLAALCNPLAIVAVYKSCRCRQAIRKGDRRRAEAWSNQALIIGTLAMIMGISVWSMTITVIWVNSIWSDGV